MKNIVTRVDDVEWNLPFLPYRGCTPSKQIEARLKPTEKKAFKSPLRIIH